MATLEELRKQFNIPGVVEVEAGRGRLPKVAVTTDLATAEFYLHGAHLTQFQPRGEKPVLFMSEESHFETGKPIRGGVPVCFPWFGPRAQPPDSPAHGFARLRSWTLESCKRRADGAVYVVFALPSDEATMRYWPHPFVMRLSFTVARSLEMMLEIQGSGSGSAGLTFEEALHTYLQVGDVRQVSVEGLENTSYLDKVDSGRAKTQPVEPIRISGETDRVFLNTRSTCVLRDPVLERSIIVEKEGSNSTVVWNPWIDKSRAMADFGDEEWPRMICIETANVGDGAVRLAAGESHRMRAHLRVSR